MLYNYFTNGKGKLRGYPIIVVLLTIMQLSSCSSISTDTMDVAANMDPSLELLAEYRIGVGDILGISVWKNPELSQQVVVLPDGRISVPLAGDIKAAGETTESLSEHIGTVLDNFIRNPEITVSVISAQSSEFLQRVRITGAINSPQSINYRRGLTVLDMVLLAGGVTPFANANKSLLYRKQGDVLKVYAIRLEDILSKGKLETNYNLLPSDIVTVPEKSF